MALICIDFDETISSGHTHNAIVRAINDAYAADFAKNPSANIKEIWAKLLADKDIHWNTAKGIPCVGKSGTWAAMLQILVNDGHQVAITSFNGFPHIIPRYLKGVLHLPDELIKKINIVSFTPEDQSNKNEHIEQAIKDAKLDGIDKKEVILVDDSERNVLAAKKAGYTGIVAKTKLGDHIPKMLVAVVHGEYESGKMFKLSEKQRMFTQEKKETEYRRPSVSGAPRDKKKLG